MELFLEIIISFTSFFDYWINDCINKKAKIKKILLQFLFVIIFSSIMSLFISFFLLIVDNISIIKINIKEIILSSSLLMIFIFFLVEYLNRKNNLNLPEKLIDCFLIIISLKGRKKGFGVIEFITFNFVAIVGMWGLGYLVIQNIGTDLAKNSNFIILVISMIVGFFIYSELTINKLERVSRQLILWLSIFILLLVLTFISLNQILQNNANIDIISVGLMVFGLIYNIATIADKVREFFKESQKEFDDSITAIKAKWHEEFSCQYQIQKSIDEVKYIWKNSTLKQKIIIIAILFTVVVYNIFLIYVGILQFK